MITTEKEINRLVDNKARDLALATIEELKPLVKKCLEEELSIENQMIMIGIAHTLANQINTLEHFLPKDELLKIDTELQSLWNKWYMKNQEFNKNLKKFN